MNEYKIFASMISNFLNNTKDFIENKLIPYLNKNKFDNTRYNILKFVFELIPQYATESKDKLKITLNTLYKKIIKLHIFKTKLLDIKHLDKEITIKNLQNELQHQKDDHKLNV
jgi:hypothetical protein